MKKIFTPIRKLHISVIFGWTVPAVLSILGLIEGGTEVAQSYLILSLVILAIRYSLFKPIELLGASFAGWMTISILEYFAGYRNAGRPEALIITVALVVGFALIKGIILAAFFLLRETYQLAMYYTDRPRFQHNRAVQQ